MWCFGCFETHARDRSFHHHFHDCAFLHDDLIPTAQDVFIARAISIFVNCHVQPVVEFPTPLDVACPVVHQALFTTSALPQSATITNC
jgi:hypothetical protein